MKEDVLLVDDSTDMLEVLSRHLSSVGYNTFQATNVLDAIDLLKLGIPKLLITDLQMPGVDGGKLVSYCQKKFPKLPILVITGYPSSIIAKEIIEDNKTQILAKPFTKIELYKSIESLISNPNPTSPLALSEAKGIIGNAASLEQTFHLIDRTKDNRVTVLISGESGTGKELVARAIHYEGKYKKAPFIAVNCGAIPEHLLEAELFGYEKGAFTGANDKRSGFFLAAEGGTLFLDEVGNAPLKVQQSLLRAIQEREITPIGARNPIKVKLRVIAATNSNLLTMVKSGSFREDLYYRLNVVNIQVPPLRDRKSDIENLSKHFIDKHSNELGLQGIKITSAAIQRLEAYAWPGNIRELENAIQQALIRCDQEIDTEHLPYQIQSDQISKTSNSVLESLEAVELKHIRMVLDYCKNNKSQAAEILGITRKTLNNKLNKAE